MVEVLATKQGHTLYNTLIEVVKNIDEDVHIIGLDDPVVGMNAPYYYRDLYSKPFFLYLEEYSSFQKPEILLHGNFRGFISHIKSICERLYKEFHCRVFYLPLSSLDRNLNQINTHIDSLGARPINLVAWGSWNDINDNNFNCRGGPAIDTLITRLLDNNHNIRLSMRTLSELKSKDKYPDRIDVYRQYQDQQKLEEIYSQGDIFLLPSFQVHSMSLVYAMSFGMPCIVSDGWGMEEYCNSINSINISNYNEIEELIQSPEKLKLKRRNTLSYNLTNHSRDNHIKNIKSIICKEVLYGNS